ncbi:MAG: phosphoadenylyl-sulfate reductase [Saprospiraceae bacterium]|nr:phosphoadenylyl-sulfate reductase [Candidatus Opimibacter iunctus]
MAEISISALIDRIGEKLDGYKSSGLSAFVSSSFQSHSLPLLHIISRFQPETPVYFLNTGFHFPETMAFRHVIADLMGLNIIDVSSPVSKAGQRDESGKFFFFNNPDHCCYLNKVLPMEPVIAQHDVWINGVRRDQTKFRATLQEEEPLSDGKFRYHPMLDWTSKMIWEYRKEYNLPEHPLEAQGYLSIGCMPCTRSFQETEASRQGRWAGMSKEECGIQTEFVKPKAGQEAEAEGNK